MRPSAIRVFLTQRLIIIKIIVIISRPIRIIRPIVIVVTIKINVFCISLLYPLTIYFNRVVVVFSVYCAPMLCASSVIR